MANGIKKNYGKQLAANMKNLSDTEKRFMVTHSEMVKQAILNAVVNDGLGVCYDAYALCQKRDKVSISMDIPVYIWHGNEDSTIPLTFIEYFQSAYSVKKIHRIDHVGHMLYLTHWNDIIQEIM